MKENILETGSIGKLMTTFAVPSVIAMLVNALYNIVDQIFIGQGVGYLANGATNVVFLITLITLSVSLLLGDGTAAYFSLNIGEKRKDVAAKGVGNTIIILLIASVITLFIGIVFLEPVLKLFGATTLIMPFALDYGRIIVLGLPLIMISTAINAVIRADGSPKYAMMSMISGAIINVILDAVFIFGFHWGVQGAAIATVIGQAVSFILSVSYLRKMNFIKLTKDDFQLIPKTTTRISALGISSFIDQISFSLVMAVNYNLIVHYGASTIYGSEIPLTAFGIGMKVQMILFSVVLGIAVGMQPIVGYNYGARNYDRVKKALYYSLSAATIASVIGWLVLTGCPDIIISMFGSTDNTLYVEFSEKFFKTYFSLIVFLGFQTVAGIFFQAIGKPKQATIISLSYQIIFRVFSAIGLCAAIGLNGVLWSGPVSDVLTFVLALAMIVMQIRLMKKTA